MVALGGVTEGQIQGLRFGAASLTLRGFIMAKNIQTIHRELGFTEGTHFHKNPANPGGYGYSDASVLEMYTMIDQIADPAVRDFIKRRVAGAKARAAERADAEQKRKEQADRDARYKQAREAELNRKEDDRLRAIIKRANPFANDTEVESLLPELKKRLMLEKSIEAATGRIPSGYEREFLRSND